SYDLHDKKQVYRRNGVKEYIVWAVADQQLYRFRLQKGRYIELAGDEGIIKSEVFPGLSLNIKALLSKDLAAVLATLQAGLGTQPHPQFVQTLAFPKC
ncbi:MAG: Uma2 family endonuclease, partial [Symploca sp. SIO2B6]|nr:Uma2 family endonuclease [Symploca sp. SIO2B6]